MQGNHPMQPGAPYPMSGGPPPSGAYEFGQAENTIIQSTATSARSWGVVSALIGGIQLLISIPVLLRTPVQGLIQMTSGVSALIVGITFVGVAKAFTDVVQTQGNDIGNLMTAVRGLGRALTTQLFAVLAALCIGFFGAIIVRST